MPVYEIPTDTLIFPHPSLADHSGLLGIGGDLNPDRLLLAYQHGIFPWSTSGEALMWWCITPRLVLRPDKLHISKSLALQNKKTQWQITFDKDFIGVMLHCKNQQRPGQKGSWIHHDLIVAFEILHQRGMAHSVEVWEDDQLIGGLYGLAIGRMFCGESMFAIKSNASKIAFMHLVRHLEAQGFDLIDCQQDTEHLRSFGAGLMEANEFFSYLKENQKFTDRLIF